MDAKQCDPVHFDPHGDVCLLVQDESDKDKVGRFFVSSKALTFACDAWNRMLGPDGHFMEAQPIDGMREIPLSDNPSALAILLNIAHLRFKEVPRTLSFDDLLEVSVLTDRYGATTLVRPWVADWIESLQNTAEQHGYEEWLWIAWEYGEKKIFERLAAQLSLHCGIDSALKCLTRNGAALCSEIGSDSFSTWYPPCILESITDVRKETITQLLNTCYEYMDMYRNAYASDNSTSVCKRGAYKRRQCDAIIFGSFIISVQEIGLNIERHDPDDIEWSVATLVEKLKSIKIFGYPYGRRSSWDSQDENHAQCSFKEEFKDKILNIVHQMPSAVQELHIIHMERQRSLLD